MDGATVTIALDEYNQLRDNAVMNNLLIDKITCYEAKMCDLQQKWCDMNNKIFNLESKLKS